MKKLFSILVCIIVLMAVSCSSPSRKSESVMDDPVNHINMGMKLFNQEKYDEAKKEFDDAILIKWEKEADKAGAYAGLGMYYGVKKDEDNAKKNAKKAVSLNDKSPLVHTCYGRTIMYLNFGKDAEGWMDDAIDHFDEAIKVAEKAGRDNQPLAEAYYFKGIAAKTGYKFTIAKDAFAKVIEIKNNDYTTDANKQWEIVQMIERAKPGSKAGAKVALMDKVGRAEIAVLFIEELKIDQVLAKKEKKTYNNDFKGPADPMKYEADKLVKAEAMTDIESHWAKNWIKQVMDKGFMEAMPNHKFEPDHKVTRAEYAMMLIRVMVLITGDETLYTKYFGESNSMFVDVRTDHYAYNAMAVLASRGIMKAEMNGEFGKDKTVSGAEALLVIRDFQNALSITF